MPTYADYAADRERAASKAAQDRELKKLHEGFDLSAKDNHSKSERPSFIVVTASGAFRDGWERIFGRKILGSSSTEG